MEKSFDIVESTLHRNNEARQTGACDRHNVTAYLIMADNPGS